MKRRKPLSEIAADLNLPWSVEWDYYNIFRFSKSDTSPYWRIMGAGNIIKASGFRRADAQFVVDAVNAAAGGYGRPIKPKFKRGDVVRVIAPFDSRGIVFGKTPIEPRCARWVGQRAIVVDVYGNTYGIYLASEGPKSYCAWWEESRLEPYSKPSKGTAA